MQDKNETIYTKDVNTSQLKSTLLDIAWDAAGGWIEEIPNWSDKDIINCSNNIVEALTKPREQE